MALGPGSVKVEIMPLAAWVDITSSLDMVNGVQMRPACGKTPWDDVEAGTCSFTLLDNTGNLWPDNPLSPYYPGLRKGMPVRVTGTLGSASSVRHVGRARSVVPSIVGDVNGGPQVQITSTDVLADLANLILRDRFSETLAYAAATQPFSTGAANWDAWPLTGNATDVTIPTSNLASPRAGLVIDANSGVGSIQFGPIDGANKFGIWNIPAMASLASNNAVGPVMLFPVTALTSGQAYLAFRTTTQAQRVVAQAYDAFGSLIWWWEIQAADGTMSFHDEIDHTITGYGFVCDGVWHTIVAYDGASALPGPGQTCFFYMDTLNASKVYDPSSIRSLVVGGSMNPKAPGKQSACFTGDVAMIGAIGVSGAGSLEHYASLLSEGADAAFLRAVSNYAGTWAVNVTATTPATAAKVINGPTQDTSVLDVARNIARTVGGRIIVAPQVTGTVATVDLWLPETPAPNILATGATSFTATLSSDDDGALLYSAASDEGPTRCQVTSPIAAGTFIGSEVDGRQDDQINSLSISPDAAYALGGGWIHSRPSGLRIDHLGIDAATAAGGQSLATALLAMFPMMTVFTLAGMPPFTGRTQDDLIACGWDETWNMVGTRFEIDTLPVRAWPAWRLVSSGDDFRYIGGGTGALTVTGSQLASAAGPVSVACASALMNVGNARYWNWAGECVLGTVSTGTLNANPTFDAGITSWFGTFATLAAVASPTHSGAGALKSTINSTAGTPRAEASGVACAPGGVYTATCWINPSTTRTVGVAIYWFDASTAFISSNTSSGSATTGVFTQFTVTATAPANAVFAEIVATEVGTPAIGLFMYVDDAVLTAVQTASPQVLTIASRAQKGTIARTHTNGDSLDIWRPARVGF